MFRQELADIIKGSGQHRIRFRFLQLKNREPVAIFFNIKLIGDRYGRSFDGISLVKKGLPKI
jgi:hypothetical protein